MHWKTQCKNSKGVSWDLISYRSATPKEYDNVGELKKVRPKYNTESNQYVLCRTYFPSIERKITIDANAGRQRPAKLL